MKMLLERRLFCIWSGNNIMSRARERCLNTIKSVSGVNVCLIGQSNIDNWLTAPIHPAYKYLSFTHKADYFRAYLMHYHGSGYCDIKSMFFDWNPYFDVIDKNPQYDAICYRERCPEHAASDNPEIRARYNELGGVCHFIMRPQSDITRDWLMKIHAILDDRASKLKECPGNYHPRAIKGGVEGLKNTEFDGSEYPLEWNEICGRILHPLLFRYRERVSLVMPNPILSNYR
jgi:hypothetical protein